MKRLALVLGIALLSVAPSQAQVAVDFKVWDNGNQFSTWSLGFQFDVTEPVAVGALGVWDTPPWEFAQAPQVGLWEGGGTLLASVFVQNDDPIIGGGYGGPSHPYESGWRFHSLETPVVLTPGVDYVVGAQNWGETMVYQPVNAVWDSRVEFICNRVGSAPGSNDPLVFPSESRAYEGVGYFGGNFMIVPEPGTYALIAGLGLGLFAAARRFRK